MSLLVVYQEHFLKDSKLVDKNFTRLENFPHSLFIPIKSPAKMSPRRRLGESHCCKR